MNKFEKKIFGIRRSYLKTPILINIKRLGFLFYVIHISKGATTIKRGYDNSIHTRSQAIDIAEEMINKFKTKNSNFRVIWKFE